MIRNIDSQSLKLGVALVLILFIALGYFRLNSQTVSAAIPKYINFQGKLTAVSGGTNVADGTYAMEFKIYNAATNGSLLWTETFDQASGACAKVAVTSGVFNVKLGTCNAMTFDVTGGSLYLSVNFAPTGIAYDGEMTPRKQLVSSAFAFNANNLVGDGKIDITNTSATQLAVKYDSSNKLELSVSSGGVSTFTASSSSAAGFIFSGGNLGVGGSATAKLQSTSTTEQLRLAYDGSNYASFTVSLGGNLTINPSGGRVSIATGDFLNTGVSGITGATAGDIWYDTTANKYKINENGTTKILCNTTDAGCGAGGSTTLQSAYDTDVDGSNATVALTSADDSLIITNPSSGGTDSAFTLQIDQANTTAAVLGLDIVQQSNSANAANITANSIDTETALAITANALTSGNGLTITSSATALTGSLAKFTANGSSASNTGAVVKIENTGVASANTGLYIDHRATGTGNLALRIDDMVSDATPLIVDSDGRLGVGTSSITGSTERLLQVGSPTNRGNMVAYGDVVSQGYSKIQALTNIKDIYLYDTTADSDGGKWIDWATTDQLSWYTESLDDSASDPCDISIDDRCYTNHFPRKAILVVTGSALYIFDASTGDMWMKFNQNAAGYALGVDTNNDPSSVTALNGVIYVGTNGASQGGLYVIDFVNDRMWNIDGTDRSAADVGIASRNSTVTYNSDNTTAFDLSVSGTAAEWEDINDVSATYVTGSSTAIATGLATNTSPGSGQTFVALATDSGITVINMTAQRLLQYSDVTADDYTSVVLTRRGRMYALNTTSDQAEMWINFDTDKANEINGAFDARYDETVGPALWSSTPNIVAGAPDALEVIERGSLADDTSDILYIGHSLGLTEIHAHVTSTNGWSKFFDTTRQTMLMPNAIDMALMLDDVSGTLANDSSFNNTDMAIKGSPTLGVSGVRGKAMQFNGTSQYLCSDANQDNTCDNDTSFNMSTTGWTLSLWFKHSTSISGNDVLFDKCYNSTPAVTVGCVTIYMNSTGNMVAAIDATTTWTAFTTYDVTATTPLAYNDNQWHQVILSRTNANDMDVYFDGNPLNLSTATGQTATLDAASQIVAFGADCSVGANCSTGANFWDGAIDDITFSAGTGTIATLSALQARRFYNDARPLVAKKVITVTDATTVSSTTIGDTGESWIPNEFAGMIMAITGGTGAGQTRRVVSNTSNTLTVNPPFSTIPDITSDFEVDPEALYGTTTSVRAIGITGEAPLGQARQMCVGTNDGLDGGGVTCYNHQAGPNIIADIFHGDSEQMDDYSIEWTGTDYDDIRSIDMAGSTLLIGSEAHFYVETRDIRLGQGLDYLANQLFNIRGELINDGITASGSMALEVGFTGGADLAEYYYSADQLEAGDVVIIDTKGDGDDVIRSSRRYSGGLLGVVSTQPGLILGFKAEDGYPIALTGRIPVKFSYENGAVQAGDYLTSASIPGYAMRATGAGPTIGKALADSAPEAEASKCLLIDPDVVSDTAKCGVVTIFVEHGNFSGLPIEQLMREMKVSVSSDGALIKGSTEGLVESHTDLLATTGLDAVYHEAVDDLTTDEKILVFLQHIKQTRQEAGQGVSAELFTDRVSAAFEVVSPQITTSGLKVEAIGKLGGSIDVFSDLVFFGRPYLNNDTAGFALIKQGQQSVIVTFEKEYIEQPVVSAAMTLEVDPNIFDESDVVKNKQLNKDQEAHALELFEKDIQALIIKKNNKGFTIIINKPAPRDIKFSWVALAVKNPKLFSSDESKEIESKIESIEEVASDGMLENVDLSPAPQVAGVSDNTQNLVDEPQESLEPNSPVNEYVADNPSIQRTDDETKVHEEVGVPPADESTEQLPLE